MKKSTWLLRPVIHVPDEPPWIQYNTNQLILRIEAKDEDEARRIADEHMPYFKMPDGKGEINHPFLSKESSTCRKISK